MSDTVITIENLGKKYFLSHQRQEPYLALRDVLTEGVRNAARKIFAPFSSRRPGDGASVREEFWALKDVSFDIQRGDRIGIIGRNGAGKSTLLKILSRITEPTEGRVRIRGRVASLLEVGTGFHPELTGRENIFLNGAILGMTKTEIKQKFDEIVCFAEVEKFLDTPVKFYSSGMYVRLAFAVAAHLEPEILVVDEVLAVGDAQFQTKCLGRMEDVSTKEGRTVMFVSHNMGAIQNLCNKSILLDHGKLILNDKTNLVVSKYLNDVSILSGIPVKERKDRQGTGDIRFTSVILQNEDGEPANAFFSGQNANLILNFENNTNRDLKNFHVSIGIDNQMGARISLLGTDMAANNFELIKADVSSIVLTIDKMPLVKGRYGFTIFSSVNGVISDWIQNAAFFDVENGDYYKTGRIPPVGQGHFLMNYRFSIGH